MYTYIVKGFSVGQILARSILRNVTGLPGAILDCIIALFWVPDYLSYWEEHDDRGSIDFMDGSRTYGIAYGIFGYVGDLVGYLVGGIGGAAIGMALCIPDLLLRGFIGLHNKITVSLNYFARFIGTTEYFKDLGAYAPPKNFIEKAWNIGMVVGMALGVIPVIAAKAIEFIFPFIPLTPIVKSGSAWIGAGVTAGASVILAFPAYLLDKMVEALSILRDKIRSGAALIYAWGRIDPESEDDGLIPKNSVHSLEFINEVRENQHTTWSQLLFGPVAKEEPAEADASRGVHYQPVLAARPDASAPSEAEEPGTRPEGQR